MKPRIRLFVVNSMGWRIWECIRGGTATGFGDTPVQAYQDWARHERKNMQDQGHG